MAKRPTDAQILAREAARRAEAKRKYEAGRARKRPPNSKNNKKNSAG